MGTDESLNRMFKLKFSQKVLKFRGSFILCTSKDECNKVNNDR